MTRKVRTWTAIGGVAAVFGAMIAAILLLGASNFRVQGDQDGFHVPTVRQFQRQWPHVDLHDYPVATAPAYHLLMAAIAHYATDDLRVLRTVGSVFGFALVILAAWAASRRSAWLALILACSSYVLTSTIWLLPENAAWLLVLVGLLLALHARGLRLFIGSAVVLAMLVFTRQSQAWMIGVFFVAALVPDDDLRPDLRPKTLVAALLGILPAVAILAWLVSMWHGLSPPSFQPGAKTILFQSMPSGGVAPGAPGMMLAVIGCFGVPLLPWLWPARRAGGVAALGGAIGFIAGVLPASSPKFPERRSGLWQAVEHLPIIADRSPLFVALAVIGGAVAAVTLLRLRPRDRLIFAAALAGATLAQAATAMLWQRYYEPFVLIWLMLAATAPAEIEPPPRTRWRFAGLTVLVVGELIVTAYTLNGTH